MKKILLCLSFLLIVSHTQLLAEIVNADPQDSLALVDFYNANAYSVQDGVSHPIEWADQTNWMTTARLGTWYGVTVDVINGRVIGLNLNNNRLVLPILPPSFGHLTKLQDLEFANDFFVGTIPEVISTFTELKILNLRQNLFSGPFPASFANLTQLHKLDLGMEYQFGPVGFPSWVTTLTNLDTLIMDNLAMTGEFPADIGNLPNLLHLDLSGNALTGELPTSIGNCWHLALFWVGGNNLHGKFPASFLALSNMRNGAMNFGYGGNHYNFDAIEQVQFSSNFYTRTSLQKKIPIAINEATLSVTAGGTLAVDTFTLFRDGTPVHVQWGDSVFKVTSSGAYSYVVRNGYCDAFTILYSDTAFIKAVLPSVAQTASQDIHGFTAFDVNVGLDKLATLQATPGANPLSGNTSVSLDIDNSVQLYHQQPYVQRHYDIQPATNASNAEATVTLFFTQGDFDNFNAYVFTNHLSIPLLPTNGTDNGNVRVLQQHGAFTGSSDPGNYNGGSILITPSVVWNIHDNWWEVTFPVTGFSGFFVSTVNIALPLTLLDFTATAADKHIHLGWSTTNETDTKSFVVERNAGNGFQLLGTVASLSTAGKHHYSIDDLQPVNGSNFYRLKMIDIDGKYNYSKTISIRTNQKIDNIFIYPNPGIRVTNLVMNASLGGNYTGRVTDNAGRQIQQISGKVQQGVNKIAIDISGWSRGVYFIDVQMEHAGNLAHLKLIKH